MNKLRRLRKHYDYSCNHKMRHQNSLTALDQAVSLNRKQPADFFAIYTCDFCNGLHIGHRDHRLPEEEIEVYHELLS
jgi:hypothetical protein